MDRNAELAYDEASTDLSVDTPTGLGQLDAFSILDATAFEEGQ